MRDAHGVIDPSTCLKPYSLYCIRASFVSEAQNKIVNCERRANIDHKTGNEPETDGSSASGVDSAEPDSGKHGSMGGG